MIEVDVRDREGAHIVDPEVIESVEQVADGVGRPAVDERPLGGVEEVAGEAVGLVGQIRIDEIEVVAEIDT